MNRLYKLFLNKEEIVAVAVAAQEEAKRQNKDINNLYYRSLTKVIKKARLQYER